MCLSTRMDIQGKLICVLHIKDYLFYVPPQKHESAYMCRIHLRRSGDILIGMTC